MKDSCIFCEIVKKKRKSYKIYEDVNTYAFLDINPRNPGHTLVVTKDHNKNIFDLPEKQVYSLFKTVKYIATAIKDGMKADGISIAQSNGSAAGQDVSHVHVHIIPRFLSEDSVSIEGMLPLKSIKKAEFPKIVSKIKKCIQ